MFSIADNVTPEGVQWDEGALVLELKEIELLAPQIELTSSALSISRIDTMFGRVRTEELAEADDALPVPVVEAVSLVGDVWRLGKHLLACGDARDAALVASLVGERRARLLLTDSPWKRDEKVAVKVDNKVVKMTRMEAWVTNLWNKAIELDPKASAHVLAIMRASGQVQSAPGEEEELDDASSEALEALIARLGGKEADDDGLGC